MAVTYTVAALVAAHQALADEIDRDLSAGSLTLHSSGDTVLATMALAYPCGTVAGGTGQLTFTLPLEDTSADAGGDVSYARFNDNSGDEIFRLDAQAGSSAVSGYIVLNTVTLVLAGPVEIISATIG